MVLCRTQLQPLDVKKALSHLEQAKKNYKAESKSKNDAAYKTTQKECYITYAELIKEEKPEEALRYYLKAAQLGHLGAAESGIELAKKHNQLPLQIQFYDLAIQNAKEWKYDELEANLKQARNALPQNKESKDLDAISGAPTSKEEDPDLIFEKLKIALHEKTPGTKWQLIFSECPDKPLLSEPWQQFAKKEIEKQIERKDYNFLFLLTQKWTAFRSILIEHAITQLQAKGAQIEAIELMYQYAVENQSIFTIPADKRQRILLQIAKYYQDTLTNAWTQGQQQDALITKLIKTHDQLVQSPETIEIASFRLYAGYRAEIDSWFSKLQTDTASSPQALKNLIERFDYVIPNLQEYIKTKLFQLIPDFINRITPTDLNNILFAKGPTALVLRKDLLAKIKAFLAEKVSLSNSDRTLMASIIHGECTTEKNAHSLTVHDPKQRKKLRTDQIEHYFTIATNSNSTTELKNEVKMFLNELPIDLEMKNDSVFMANLNKKLSILEYKTFWSLPDSIKTQNAQQKNLQKWSRHNLLPALASLDNWYAQNTKAIGRRLYLNIKMLLLDVKQAESDFPELKTQIGNWLFQSKDFLEQYANARVQEPYRGTNDAFEYYVMAKWYLHLLNNVIPRLSKSEQQRVFNDPDAFLLKAASERETLGKFTKKEYEAIAKRTSMDMKKAMGNDEWMSQKTKSMETNTEEFVLASSPSGTGFFAPEGSAASRGAGAEHPNPALYPNVSAPTATPRANVSAGPGAGAEHPNLESYPSVSASDFPAATPRQLVAGPGAGPSANTNDEEARSALSVTNAAAPAAAVYPTLSPRGGT